MKKSLLLFISTSFVFLTCGKPKHSVAQTTARGLEQVEDAMLALTGLVGLNDASRVIKSGSKYFWYSTDGGIKMRWTADPKTGIWNTGPDVFPTRPAFWSEFSPRNTAWAPDVVYDSASQEFRMYYSVSSMGSTKSAIALATNKTLDFESPEYAWVDKGIVISTPANAPYNALDPCPVLTPDGEWFLCFGSHFGGIKLIRLASDGKIHPTDTTMWNLARKEPTSNSAIEAGAIYPGVKNGQKGYWLFVNWGSGLGKKQNATYEVRIGWSADIRGPYLDKEGKDMYNGGGSVFITNRQTFDSDNSIRIGRGHVGIIKGHLLDGAHPDWVSYSYWLGNTPIGQNGKRFGLQQLVTDADGWPAVGDLFKN